MLNSAQLQSSRTLSGDFVIIQSLRKDKVLAILAKDSKKNTQLAICEMYPAMLYPVSKDSLQALNVH